MSDLDRVTIYMPGYIADGLSVVLEEKARSNNDTGWAELSKLLRQGGHGDEVLVVREAEADVTGELGP